MVGEVRQRKRRMSRWEVWRRLNGRRKGAGGGVLGWNWGVSFSGAGDRGLGCSSVAA